MSVSNSIAKMTTTVSSNIRLWLSIFQWSTVFPLSVLMARLPTWRISNYFVLTCLVDETMFSPKSMYSMTFFEVLANQMLIEVLLLNKLLVSQRSQ